MRKVDVPTAWYDGRAMASAVERCPMRWPPSWRDPSLLKLLAGTPINLLLTPADPGLDAVRSEARRMGLTCWEIVTAPPSRPDQIRIQQRSELEWNRPGAVVAVSDCVWPSIASESRGSAGPTGVPWVDSNGWFAQLARALMPRSEIWLVFDPPGGMVLRAESYALAVADSEAFGGRWAVSLDEQAQADKGLAARIIHVVGDALRFFGQHRAWSSYVTCAVLGVLSDYAGEDRHMAEEILNLLARRHLPFRVLRKTDDKSQFEGLKAIICPDARPPATEVEQRLLDFVRQGGLLIANAGWRVRGGTPGPEDVHRRFDVFLLGKGRLAVAREPFSDPYLVALDAHLLLGRRHDLVRLWNGGSLNIRYTGQPGGRRAVVQLVNYSTRHPAHEVTLGVTARYRRAWFWELGANKPRALEVRPAPQGIELPLPEFAIYGAVELEE
jgi:hypothetical protein